LKSQSPHALVSFSVLVCLVVVLVCVYLALHLPWLGITIQYHEPTEQWQVAAIHPDSINRKTFEDHLQKNNLQLPLAIAFIQAGDQTISLSQNLFMEEPDTLPTYAQFNSLMQDQQQLFVASENKNL